MKLTSYMTIYGIVIIDRYFIKVSPCKHQIQYNTKTGMHSHRVLMRNCNNYVKQLLIHDMKIRLHDKIGIMFKSNIN